MSKQRKLVPDLDLRPLLTKTMNAYELRIIYQAIKAVAPGEEFERDALVVKYEEVEGYPVDVYTIRYRGEIILRRLPADLLGTRFHYESPVFND